MNFFDLDHPFFLPLWRRVLVVALSLGWALVELTSGNQFWAMIFGFAGAFAAYSFFIKFDAEAIRRKKDNP